MKHKYEEIQKLKEMLDENGIPNDFLSHGKLGRRVSYTLPKS